MSDSPRRYILPPSSRSKGTPVPDWVWRHSDVADSVDDLGPDVAVPVDDLRPRAKNVQITLDAVDDIRFCEKLFDKWMTELDNITSDTKKRDEREKTLRFYLGRLKEQAGLCSDTTNEILQRHVLFASLMAQRIDDASKSQYNLKYDGPETTKLAKDINKASRSLSTNVTQMTMTLTHSFRSREGTGHGGKGRSLAERILRWLKTLFKAIAKIFATLSPSISESLLHHPDSRIRGCAFAVTALGQAASVFCAMDSEPKKGKVSESLDSAILFLKEIVPNEAQNAQKKLERFDEALDIIGLERKMSTGRRVTLYGSDPATVAEEWRDVASSTIGP
ncbi:hypothetical protein BGY98DRAFT_1104501 [Russula aff. rugulosa BPL654]|nr:hypothetical protein BGY98DRAFT_1104501 [Russula aff. rugulosa BPL654]